VLLVLLGPLLGRLLFGRDLGIDPAEQLGEVVGV